MKKIITITIVFIAIINTCFAQNPYDTTVKLTTTITKTDIVDYIKKHYNKRDDKPISKAFIENVIKNMQYEKLTVEWKGLDDQSLIIPITNTNFSQHSKINNIKALQYLLVVKDKSENILGTKIYFIFPKDKSLKVMPKHAFQNYFLQNNHATDGTYALIGYFDNKMLETDVENGIKIQVREWDKTNNYTNNGIDNCRTWKLTTIDIFTDKPPVEKTETLGTNCSECPPGYICDPLKK